MPRLKFLVAVAAASVVPALAFAQQDFAAQQRAYEAQLRMQEAQRRLEVYEQTQRLDQTQRQIEDLDQRIRTNENIRNLEAQRARIPAETPVWIPPAAGATPAQLAEAERRRQASLDASEARLRALSEQQRLK